MSDEDELRWFRVTANVQARSADDAEAIVAKALPPPIEGSLAPSHVADVQEARWYTVLIAMPPPNEPWLTAFLATSEEEVLERCLANFDADQISEIKLL